MLRPKNCTSGVLIPNSTAAINASAPPRIAGRWAEGVELVCIRYFRWRFRSAGGSINCLLEEFSHQLCFEMTTHRGLTPQYPKSRYALNLACSSDKSVRSGKSQSGISTENGNARESFIARNDVCPTTLSVICRHQKRTRTFNFAHYNSAREEGHLWCAFAVDDFAIDIDKTSTYAISTK